jgi:hypothetical protein
MASTHACARTRKPSLCLPGNERLVEGEFVRPRRIIDRLAREAENEQLLPPGDERLGQPVRRLEQWQARKNSFVDLKRSGGPLDSRLAVAQSWYKMEERHEHC